MLTDAQKTALLQTARTAVAAHLSGRTPQLPAAPAMPEASGVFVTLKRRGELRGCLGTLQTNEPLQEEVARCACDSATRDPRFHPVSPGELGELSLEISVLGPLEPVDPLHEDAITIGRHGLVIEDGPRRGLLLPQVASEWGWTREQFLRQTCRKAGLPEDAWREGARVYRFDAEVFGE